MRRILPRFDATTALALVAALLVLASPAEAYVGPGAGVSLLGALWALVAAVFTAIVFVVAWPIRRMLRKSKRPSAERAGEEHVRAGAR